MAERDPALQRAFNIAKVRSIAKELDISTAALYRWRKCPPAHVLTLERLTEGKVSRHDLRPDLYPREA